MDRALTVLAGVVAGLVVVFGVAALALTFRGDDGPLPALQPLEPSSFPPVEHDPEAAADLFDAWGRWRTATFVSSGTWTRTLDAAPVSPLVVDVYTAQDRPRRVQVRFEGVTRIEDAEEYDAQLGSELRLVGEYVLGAERLYDVADVGDGCFQAELIVAALGSPWGRWAEYCFDEETGALESARVRRQSAVDVERHNAIRAEVEDLDFGSAGG